MKSLIQVNDLEEYGCPTYGIQECDNTFFIKGRLNFVFFCKWKRA